MKKLKNLVMLIKYPLIVYLVFGLIDYCLYIKVLHHNIFEVIPNLNIYDSSNIFLTINLTIFVIFTALIVLIFQVFRNKYPEEALSKYFENNITKIFFLIAIQLMVSILLSFTNGGNSYLEFGYVGNSIYLFSIFFIFIFDYKNFNPYSLLDVATTNLLIAIDTCEIDEKKIKKLMLNYREYFNNSLRNNESELSKKIIYNLYTILKTYLTKLNELRLNGKIEDRELKSLENEILVDTFFFNYRICTTSNNEYLKVTYNNTIYTILLDLTKCDNISIYELLTDALDMEFKYISATESYFQAVHIIFIYSQLYENIIVDDTKKNFQKEIENKFLSLFFIANSFVGNKIVLGGVLIQEYFHILSIQISNNKKELFNEYLEKSFNSILLLIKEQNENLQKSFFSQMVYLIKICQIDNKDKSYIEIVIEQIKKLIIYSLISQQKELCVIGSFLLNEVIDVTSNIEIKNIINKLKLEYLLKTIEVFPEISSNYLPDYRNEFENTTIDIVKVERIIENYKEIFYGLIRLKRTKIYYRYLETYNDLIKSLKIEHKFKELYITEYKNIFRVAFEYESYDNFRISLYSFEKLLLYLDKEDDITDELLKEIFVIIENTSKYVITDETANMAISYISFVEALLEKMKCVQKCEQHKHQIIEIIFNIAIDAIELKNNEIIRKCSNTLGWIAKDAIDSGDVSSYRYSIDHAIKLLKLVRDFDFEEDISIFIGTLFIVVGAYTIFKNKVQEYNFIEKRIASLSDLVFLAKSKKIRTYKAKFWGKDFDNRAGHYFDEFYRKIQKKK